MSITIKGAYRNGQVLLSEPAPTDEEVAVDVIFPQSTMESKERMQKNEIRFGSLAGKISVPDDFTDELDDLDEYR